jgi:hypothetical protein
VSAVSFVSTVSAFSARLGAGKRVRGEESRIGAFSAAAYLELQNRVTGNAVAPVSPSALLGAEDSAATKDLVTRLCNPH